MRRRRQAQSDYYRRIPDKFRVHYTQSPYHFAWSVIVDRLRPLEQRSVLEVGCGTGQLAQMLRDYGLSQYVGFDFSAERVAVACESGLRFEVADAFTTDLFESDYDTVIATEFLEHVDRDLDVLARIRSGTRVLATVPNYDAPSHVRYFTDAQQVEERYRGFDVTPLRRDQRRVLYLIDGVA